jgi:SAM-dependent methyltransferase
MRKLTDKPMTAFYREHRTDVKTLDVGSAGGRNKVLYPNSITVDIDPNNKPDVVADAHSLPFADASFGCIVCKEVLEHVKRPDIVINEFMRVLTPGGKLILSTRFLFPIHEAPNDGYRFTKYALLDLFKAWSTVDIKDEADPITTIVILIDRMIYQSDFKFNKVSKGLLLLITYLILPFKYLLLRQYGDVGKAGRVDSAFTSGYYVIAYK